MTIPESLTIQIDGVVRLAVELRATQDGVSPADAVHAALRKALAAEIEQVFGSPPLASVIQEIADAGRRQGGSRNQQA